MVYRISRFNPRLHRNCKCKNGCENVLALDFENNKRKKKKTPKTLGILLAVPNNLSIMSDQIPVENQQVPSENSEEVKNKLEEMEQETAKLRELHSQLSSESTNGVTHPTDEEKRDTDARSIYIGNVDYGSTPLELQQHFSSAGVVNRVTILTNKFTGQPKGFAYLEFADTDAVNKAVATLDGSTFRERQLKVLAKRTNIPGISVKRGFPGRGRGNFRGGRGRGGRGGRGGFRGARGGPRFNPY